MAGSTHLGQLPCCISLDMWEGGVVKSVEAEYKQHKIKSAVKLYGNEYPTMGLVRAFEEQSAGKRHRSLVKETGKFVEELGVSLNLSYPKPRLYDEEVSKENIKEKLKQRVREHNEVRANRVDARMVNPSGNDSEYHRDELPVG
ncbi:hypothetical protein AWC38_SpisGene17906 [Stylophora pistillata]|uniref:Uncharacterized protein n=1 Tax=Stylophora pistillata TaxID=50429 RepID=A0A2B4RKQ1_STYPI|nr:hypothetical protein AWC38_SpisGene17906 [Stylophora pistillata]